MLNITQHVPEVTDVKAGDVPEHIQQSATPLVLRGFADHWPLVKAGKASFEAAADYLCSFYQGRPISACRMEAEQDGRVARLESGP